MTVSDRTRSMVSSSSRLLLLSATALLVLSVGVSADFEVVPLEAAYVHAPMSHMQERTLLGHHGALLTPFGLGHHGLLASPLGLLSHGGLLLRSNDQSPQPPGSSPPSAPPSAGFFGPATLQGSQSQPITQLPSGALISSIDASSKPLLPEDGSKVVEVSKVEEMPAMQQPLIQRATVFFPENEIPAFSPEGRALLPLVATHHRGGGVLGPSGVLHGHGTGALFPHGIVHRQGSLIGAHLREANPEAEREWAMREGTEGHLHQLPPENGLSPAAGFPPEGSSFAPEGRALLPLAVHQGSGALLGTKAGLLGHHIGGVSPLGFLHKQGSLVGGTFRAATESEQEPTRRGDIEEQHHEKPPLEKEPSYHHTCSEHGYANAPSYGQPPAYSQPPSHPTVSSNAAVLSSAQGPSYAPPYAHVPSHPQLSSNAEVSSSAQGQSYAPPNAHVPSHPQLSSNAEVSSSAQGQSYAPPYAHVPSHPQLSSNAEVSPGASYAYSPSYADAPSHPTVSSNAEVLSNAHSPSYGYALPYAPPQVSSKGEVSSIAHAPSYAHAPMYAPASHPHGRSFLFLDEAGSGEEDDEDGLDQNEEEGFRARAANGENAFTSRNRFHPGHGMFPSGHGGFGQRRFPPRQDTSPTGHGFIPSKSELLPSSHGIRPPSQGVYQPSHGVLLPEHGISPPSHGRFSPSHGSQIGFPVHHHGAGSAGPIFRAAADDGMKETELVIEDPMSERSHVFYYPPPHPYQYTNAPYSVPTYGPYQSYRVGMPTNLAGNSPYSCGHI